MSTGVNLANKRIFVKDSLDISTKELEIDKKETISHFIDFFNEPEDNSKNLLPVKKAKEVRD